MENNYSVSEKLDIISFIKDILYRNITDNLNNSFGRSFKDNVHYKIKIEGFENYLFVRLFEFNQFLYTRKL